MPHAPEPFTLLASDGQTELDGVLYKPYNFDPSKKYPVVDFIYGGPQMTRVPRTFTAGSREQALANMGMVLVVVDARGTPARGKAFLDVAYGSMGRYVIPDHVAAVKQLAANRPYLDSNRVAVLGGSMGGYFAARAMLEAPEVYQVGVAMAPVYELGNSLGALWRGSVDEKQMVDDAGSNLLQKAGDLGGRLLIIHGTSDLNAPFGGTIRMIDALERANKPYDLVLLPEMDLTGQNSPYSLQSIRRYQLNILVSDNDAAVLIQWMPAGHLLGLSRAVERRPSSVWARGSLVGRPSTALPEIVRFCDGLRRDEKAVNAAIVLPWSNGQVEGQIHRLKLVKRQMYGRAKFNLLRRRVLPYVAAAVTLSPSSAP